MPPLQRPLAEGDAGFRDQGGREDTFRSAHRPRLSQAGASGTAIPATADNTTAANSGAGSSWSIQLAGGKTASEANAAFSQLRKKRVSLLADRGAMLLKKRIGADAGHWHYIRIAADSRQAATRLCARLLAAGETCTVVANEPLKEPAEAALDFIRLIKSAGKPPTSSSAEAPASQ
jgi:SPOR domain